MMIIVGILFIYLIGKSLEKSDKENPINKYGKERIHYQYWRNLSVSMFNDLLKKNQAIIYCTTEEDAKIVLSYLETFDYHWDFHHDRYVSNNGSLTTSSWKYYKRHTCYQLSNIGTVRVRHLGWCAERKYPIIYARDFRALIIKR